VRVRDVKTGAREEIPCSKVLSSMPVRDLLLGISGADLPPAVREVAEGLPYRDFVTCGLLLSRLELANGDGSPILDNWIYIQEPEVRLGRLQVFNNWSPYLVSEPEHVWLGLEYFCNEGDEMWETPDEQFAGMAAAELARIGIIDVNDVLDHVVHRVKKAYPAYFGTYETFGVVRDWLDSIPNLFVMGRNGTHRYNNMDHSMLSAWAAVEAAVGTGSRSDIWSVNADEDYHEAGSADR
jgi:protoporphyrinogen oxidase